MSVLLEILLGLGIVSNVAYMYWQWKLYKWQLEQDMKEEIEWHIPSQNS